MAWSSPGPLLAPTLSVYLKCNGNVPSDPFGQYTWEDITAYLSRRTDLSTGLFHALEQAEEQQNDKACTIRQAVCECLQYLDAEGKASRVVELLQTYTGDIADYSTKASWKKASIP
jgi:hypothetical protein